MPRRRDHWAWTFEHHIRIWYAYHIAPSDAYSKIYVVNSDIKNVIGVWDPNVLFKRPGPLSKAKNVENLKGETLLWKDLKINFKHIECVKVLCKYVTTEF